MAVAQPGNGFEWREVGGPVTDPSSGKPILALALAFLQFVNGPEGRPIMKRYGFLLPGDF
jgi:hypothetical protein